MKDLHQLAGAYVLDALDAEEREEFEAYMATSPATVAEVESLREVTVRLATAAAETPPRGLRMAVMSEIDATRQLPPIIPDAETVETAAPASMPAPVGPGLSASGQSPVATVVSIDEARTRRLSRMTQAVGAVAAVAVVIALGLATTASNLSNRLDDVEQTSAQIALLAAAPDAERFRTDYPSGGTVTAMISAEHGAFAVADGLPELTEGEIYALWGLTEGGPVPIGALQNGQALAVSLQGIGALGLTVEPDGPLSLPTGDVQATLGA